MDLLGTDCKGRASAAFAKSRLLVAAVGESKEA